MRFRWQDVLDPQLKKDPFTKEEDQLLLKVVEEQSVGELNFMPSCWNVNIKLKWIFPINFSLHAICGMQLFCRSKKQ